MTDAYIAVDFGGRSGRVIAGYTSEGRLELDTIYRFQNRQVRMGGHIYWDFLALFEDMKKGLRMAVDKGYRILSIGIDTWGVDFGLIDRNGNLLGNPVCYRRYARKSVFYDRQKGALFRFWNSGNGYQYTFPAVCHEDGRQQYAFCGR